MNRKTVQERVICALIGAIATIIVLFIGPFRNMASANDIKDFVTGPQVQAMIPTPDTRYAEERQLLLSRMESIDKMSANLVSLTVEVATLGVQVKALTEEVRSSKTTTNE